MWVVLQQMYGHKPKDISIYQLMKKVYSLCWGKKFVAENYGALKARWEDILLSF